MPGALRRFGPANDTGLARGENIGSVRNVTPSMRTSIVECPIHVRLGFATIALGSYATRGAPPFRPTSDVHVFRAKNGTVTVGPGHDRAPAGLTKRSPRRGAPLPVRTGGLAHAIARITAAATSARRVVIAGDRAPDSGGRSRPR